MKVNGLLLVTALLQLFALGIALDPTSASFEDQHPAYRHQQHSLPKSGKPKKYKCILVDEDDESPTGGIAGGVSYVNELQQRRLQAASLVEKSQTDRIATPTLTRPQQQSGRVLSTSSRTSNLALPRAEDSSPSAFKTKPLKQITLTRSSQSNSNFIAEAPNYPPPPIQTTVASPTMKLSQEYCNMIKHYAALYQVRDVLGWVQKNCAFAKTYLPNATCQEINTLVASCYRFFKQ